MTSPSLVRHPNTHLLSHNRVSKHKINADSEESDNDDLQVEIIDESHPEVRGEALEMADYVEEANDFERNITSDVTSAAADQDQEEEEDDPMETEIDIPLDMEDEAFYFCTGYVTG